MLKRASCWHSSPAAALDDAAAQVESAPTPRTFLRLNLWLGSAP